jgi:hypothetical protein
MLGPERLRSRFGLCKSCLNLFAKHAGADAFEGAVGPTLSYLSCDIRF